MKIALSRCKRFLIVLLGSFNDSEQGTGRTRTDDGKNQGNILVEMGVLLIYPIETEMAKLLVTRIEQNEAELDHAGISAVEVTPVRILLPASSTAVN